MLDGRDDVNTGMYMYSQRSSVSMPSSYDNFNCLRIEATRVNS